MTVEVPSAFLKSESTVYPVFIDPTLTVNEGGTTPTQILDYGVYSDFSYYMDASFAPDMHFVRENMGMAIYKLVDFYDPEGVFCDFDEYAIGKVTFFAKAKSGFHCNIVASPMNVDYGSTNTYGVNDELFGNYSENHSSSTEVNIQSGSFFVIFGSEITLWRKSEIFYGIKILRIGFLECIFRILDF